MAAPGLKGEVNRCQEVLPPFPGGYIVWEGKLVVWGNRIDFKSYDPYHLFLCGLKEHA